MNKSIELYILPLWDNKHLKYWISTSTESRIWSHLRTYPQSTVAEGYIISSENPRIIRLMEQEIKQIFWINTNDIPKEYKWKDWHTELAPISNIKDIIKYIEDKKKYIPNLVLKKMNTKTDTLLTLKNKDYESSLNSESIDKIPENNINNELIPYILWRLSKNSSSISTIYFNQKEVIINCSEDIKFTPPNWQRWSYNGQTRNVTPKIVTDFYYTKNNQISIKINPELSVPKTLRHDWWKLFEWIFFGVKEQNIPIKIESTEAFMPNRQLINTIIKNQIKEYINNIFDNNKVLNVAYKKHIITILSEVNSTENISMHFNLLSESWVWLFFKSYQTQSTVKIDIDLDALKQCISNQQNNFDFIEFTNEILTQEIKNNLQESMENIESYLQCKL